MSREAELLNEGWRKRSTHNEPRLSELASLYREIGHEVHLEPFEPASNPGCSECMRGGAEHYQTLYTRPSGPSDQTID